MDRAGASRDGLFSLRREGRGGELGAGAGPGAIRWALALDRGGEQTSTRPAGPQAEIRSDCRDEVRGLRPDDRKLSTADTTVETSTRKRLDCRDRQRLGRIDILVKLTPGSNHSQTGFLNSTLRDDIVPAGTGVDNLEGYSLCAGAAGGSGRWTPRGAARWVKHLEHHGPGWHSPARAALREFKGGHPSNSPKSSPSSRARQNVQVERDRARTYFETDQTRPLFRR
jgi:hypothetical protein